MICSWGNGDRATDNRTNSRSRGITKRRQRSLPAGALTPTDTDLPVGTVSLSIRGLSASLREFVPQRNLSAPRSFFSTTYGERPGRCHSGCRDQGRRPDQVVRVPGDLERRHLNSACRRDLGHARPVRDGQVRVPQDPGRTAQARAGLDLDQRPGPDTAART